MDKQWEALSSAMSNRDVVDKDVVEVLKKVELLNNQVAVDVMNKYEIISIAREIGAIMEKYNYKMNELDSAYRDLRFDTETLKLRVREEMNLSSIRLDELQKTKQLVVKLAAVAGQSHIFDEEWAKK